MNDRLIDILKQADADVGDRFDTDALVDNVHGEVILRRMRQSRIRRGTLAVVVFGGLAAIGNIVSKQPSKPTETFVSSDTGAITEVNPVDYEVVKASIERLNREASDLLAVVDALKLRESERNKLRKETKPRSRGVDIFVRPHLAAETAAQSMLMRGDMLRSSELTASSATAAYERVIELFPDSAAAQDARQRIRDGVNSEGDKV